MHARRTLIYTGGRLGQWALDYIQPGDRLVGADRGAAFLVANGFEPDLSLGDFDSVTEEEMAAIRKGSKETRDCDPIDKDYSDTELALQFAIECGSSEIILLGALGTRFDHSLANVHLLKHALDRQIPALIADQYNTLRLTTDQLVLTRSSRRYVSLLPLTSAVKGITLEGFQYPLTEATLVHGQSLGVSNVLLASKGTINIREGLLLVIESDD